MFGGKSLNFIIISPDGRAQIGLTNKTVRGIEYLANLVMYYLLTEYGSNVFDSEAGTFFFNVPTSDVELWISQSIENVKERIFAYQEKNENLDPDERLADIVIEDIKFVPENEEVNVTLKVISEAGETARITI